MLKRGRFALEVVGEAAPLLRREREDRIAHASRTPTPCALAADYRGR
jgi:hypothetical protein